MVGVLTVVIYGLDDEKIACSVEIIGGNCYSKFIYIAIAVDGIKVIAASMAVTGSGILMLSFFADNGAATAATVAIVILASAYPLWKNAAKPGKNHINTAKPFTKV